MPGHGWMVDVLTDLKAYADRNGLSDLADRLADTEDAARRELRLVPDGREADNVIVLGIDVAGPRGLPRAAGAS